MHSIDDNARRLCQRCVLFIQLNAGEKKSQVISKCASQRENTLTHWPWSGFFLRNFSLFCTSQLSPSPSLCTYVLAFQTHGIKTCQYIDENFVVSNSTTISECLSFASSLLCRGSLAAPVPTTAMATTHDNHGSIVSFRSVLYFYVLHNVWLGYRITIWCTVSE